MKKIILATCLLTGIIASGPTLAQSSSRLDEVLKSGKLRVCSPGDYKPFSLAKPDGTFEGLDIDLIQSAAKSLGVQIDMVKTSWPNLLADFSEKCDIAVGGISTSTDRAKRVGFMTAYMVNGKTPIALCTNAKKFQSVADMNKPSVRVITNPGGSNEKFVRANLASASINVFNDNVTIFDEIVKGNADVMISESVEAIVQAKAKPSLCAINPDKPLQYGEMTYLLPRGDLPMKAWFDTWLHLSKSSGEYTRIVDKWLN